MATPTSRSETEARAVSRRDVPPSLVVDLAVFRPPDLLSFLGQTRATGLLVARTRGLERSLTVRDGDVCWATSTLQTERLGDLLVRFGFVEQVALDRELRRMQSEPDGRRLGQRLVRVGLLDGHRVWKAVRLQLSEISFGLLAETQGRASFFARADEPTLASHLSIDPQTLLLEGARRLDEMRHFRARIPSAAVVPRHTGRALRPGASEEEQLLFEQVDGARPLAALASATRLGEFEATKALHRMLERGTVELLDGQREREPEPAAFLAACNLVLADVFHAMLSAGHAEPYRVSIDAYMDSEWRTGTLLSGVVLEQFGTVPDEEVLANAAQGRCRPGVLRKALEALVAFALFQAREILGGVADALEQRARAALVEASGKGR